MSEGLEMKKSCTQERDAEKNGILARVRIMPPMDDGIHSRELKEWASLDKGGSEWKNIFLMNIKALEWSMDTSNR